jgi:serine/threonine protein kinase
MKNLSNMVNTLNTITIGGIKCFLLKKTSRLNCFISVDQQYFIKQFISKNNSNNEMGIMKDIELYGQKDIHIEKPIVPLINIINDSHKIYHQYPFIVSDNLRKLDFSKENYNSVLKCIEYLHRNNIVHLDIKLENFIVYNSKNIYTVDLEFSKIIEQPYIKIPRRCGTKVYVSPEVMNKQLISLKSDIYSLGKLYYYMKTRDYKFNYKYHSNISDNERTMIDMMTHNDCEKRPNIYECIDYFNSEIMV